MPQSESRRETRETVTTCLRRALGDDEYGSLYAQGGTMAHGQIAEAAAELSSGNLLAI
jgi:hypothetical protein